MQAKVRRIDFSPDEWLAGTVELSVADRGVYITVCALIYSHGKRIKNELVAQHTRLHGNALNASLSRLVALHKIYRKGSEIGQKRCENELENTRKRSENARENVNKRWKNNDVDNQSVLQRGNANHQPSTTNHQIPPKSPKGDFSRKKNGISEGDGLQPEQPWTNRIASFKKSGFWLPQWGPKPGEPGCFAETA